MSKTTTTRFTIIGAGAGGLCAGIKLKESGQDDFLIFDREPRVGGTWQRNTYPGLECDIASPLYCFSFAPNPDWSGPFPPQPEIREYIEGVAKDHGLESHLRLGMGAVSATWDEAAARWTVRFEDGSEVVSQFVISALGMFGPRGGAVVSGWSSSAPSASAARCSTLGPGGPVALALFLYS